MRTLSALAFSLASLSLVACGGDDGGSVTVVDAPVACKISATSFPALEATAVMFNRGPQDSAMPTGPYRIAIGAAITQDTPPDALFVEVWPGFGGVPAGEVTTGTYQLTGDETTSEDCGACVIVSSNFVNMQGGDEDYMPISGTMTINSVTPAVGGAIDITLSNVMLRHVNIAPMGTTTMTTPANDGCVTALPMVHLAGSIVAGKRGTGDAGLVRPFARR